MVDCFIGFCYCSVVTFVGILIVCVFVVLCGYDSLVAVFVLRMFCICLLFISDVLIVTGLLLCFWNLLVVWCVF